MALVYVRYRSLHPGVSREFMRSIRRTLEGMKHLDIPGRRIAVGSSAMDKVDEAGRVGAVEIAKLEALAQFNDDYKTAPKIPFRANGRELAAMNRYLGTQIVSTYKRVSTNDHLHLEAARHLLREDLARHFPHNSDVNTVLHVGATMRDFKEWKSHLGHDFLFAMKEDKDMARTYEDLVTAVGDKVANMSLPALTSKKGNSTRLMLQGFKEAAMVLQSGGRTRIRRSINDFDRGMHNVVFFPDSLYDMTIEDFSSFWEHTAANVGYATLFVPDPMITEFHCPSEIYDYSEYFEPVEDVQWLIDQVWPSVLLFTPILPLSGIAETFDKLMRFCLTTGWASFSDFLTRLARDSYPVEMFFGVSLDVLKVVPIYKHLMTFLKPLLRRLLGRVRVSWKDGYENGYDHKISTWEPWIKQRRFKVHSGWIDSEVISTRGEMRLVRFWRSNAMSPLVHTLEVPKSRSAVKILDLEESYRTNLFGGEIRNPVYVNVNAKDWEEIVNFLLAEPEESLDFSVVMTTMNRIRGGLSLASNVLVEPMALDDRYVSKVSLAAFLYVAQRKGVISRIMDDPKVTSDYKSNVRRFAETAGKISLIIVTGGLIMPMYYLLKWMVDTNPTIEFVKYPEAVKPVVSRRKAQKKMIDIPMKMNVCLSHRAEKDVLTCSFCQMQRLGKFSKSGKEEDGQVLICESAKEKNVHDFRMDTEAVTKAVIQARDAEMAHRAMGATKLVPHIEKFKHWLEANSGGVGQDVSVDFIYGGPGTGKTEIIKVVADYYETLGFSVGIMTPFSALQQDYIMTEVIGKKGVRTFPVNTTWYGTSWKKLDILFVDECSAVDFSFIKTLMAYTGATRLVLVGDNKQTHLNSAAGEGVDPTNPESGLNWDAVDKHQLTKNYRLDPWRVKWCNYKHGYKMICASGRNELLPPRFITRTEYAAMKSSGKGCQREFVFSHQSAEGAFGTSSAPGRDNENMSVRSSQGLTVKGEAAVSAFTADGTVSQVDGMLLVAVTRSTGQTWFVAAESLDDPVPMQLMKELMVDSEENKSLISTTPWPKQEQLPQAFSLNEDETRLNNYMKQKASFGEVKILKDDASSDTLVDSISLSSQVHKFSANLPGKDEVEASAFLFFQEYYHMCFFLGFLSEPRFLGHRTKVLGFLSEFYLTDHSKFPRTEGKYWMPITPLIQFVESELRVPVVRLGSGSSKSVVYKSSGFEVSEFRGAFFFTVENNHVRPFLKEILVSSPDLDEDRYMAPWEVVDGRMAFESKYTKKSGPRSEYVGAPSLVRVDKVEMAPKHRRIVEQHSPLVGSYKTNTLKVPDPKPSSSKLRLGTDGYRLARYVDPSGAARSERLNNAAPFLGPVRKTNVKVNLDGFIHKRTKAGRISRANPIYYRSVTPGMGNHFNNTPVESLVAAQRIGVSTEKPKLTAESLAYVKEITREAYNSYWRPDYVMNRHRINEVILRAMRDIKARNYHGRSDAEENKHNFSTKLTCSNKDQFKPIKDGKLNLAKGGQVLLQSPPRVNMEFMAWMRLQGVAFKEAMRPDVFSDDFETESAFRTRLTRAIAALPEGCQVAIADGQEWDSQQNMVTLEIEKEMCRLFRATDPVIDKYFEIRGPLPFIMYGIFKGVTNGEKGSGFLDTKLGNTKLTSVLSNRIFSGVGSKVVAFKGDDYLRVQTGIKVNEVERSKIKTLLGMSVNVTVGKGGEFCGNSVFRKGIFPSVTRATMKALGSKSRSYEEFTAHQISWRDKMAEYRLCGLEEMVAFSAYAESTCPNYVWTCLTVLNSMCHVGKDVWLKFSLRTNSKYHLPDARGVRLL